MRDLSQNLIALANSYRQAGDEASAQAALQMSVNLGQRLDGSAGETMIGQLVGVAIERNALSAMDPSSPYGSAGQTVKDRLDQLAQQRAAIKELAQQVEAVVQTMSARDWVSYNDRQRAYGEEAAARW